MTILDKFRYYFSEIGIKAELIRKYTSYIRRLKKTTNAPVIFEFGHLAKLLGRTEKYLASAVNSSDAHYRTFKIPKRRGGMREISAPYPALLECQRWINSHILSKAGSSYCAHGFVRRRSILTNARVHAGQKMMLKADIKDFFPSIGISRVIMVFRKFGYAPNVAFYLASLCCLNGVLPQGAATSPALSNIISRRLDARLYGLARKFGLRYSRYADDLTFSGDRIPARFIGYINGIIAKEGFELNEGKTRLLREKNQKIITGINVTNKQLTVPRQFKRQLRRDVFHLATKGYFDHLNNRKIFDPFYIDTIYGRMLFWQSVEPQNDFVAKYIGKMRDIRNEILVSRDPNIL